LGILAEGRCRRRGAQRVSAFQRSFRAAELFEEKLEIARGQDSDPPEFPKAEEFAVPGHYEFGPAGAETFIAFGVAGGDGVW
jgi:hypothetical protein